MSEKKFTVYRKDVSDDGPIEVIAFMGVKEACRNFIGHEACKHNYGHFRQWRDEDGSFYYDCGSVTYITREDMNM